jgi:hypothetical protein
MRPEALVGSALYIELKDAPPGLDTFMHGKPLARSWGALDVVAEKLGIPSLTKIVVPNWRLPDKWIPVFEAYLAHVKNNPGSVTDADGVIDDLESVLRLLREALRAKSKWRLMVDY